MLLQDKGLERWLQPDAYELYGFTHIFPLLLLDKQLALAGLGVFFEATDIYSLQPYSPFNTSKDALLECLFLYWCLELKIYFKLLDSKQQPPEG